MFLYTTFLQKRKYVFSVAQVAQWHITEEVRPREIYPQGIHPQVP